jgi:positive regulator of sigma E activity
MQLSCSGRVFATDSGNVLVSDGAAMCQGCAGATSCGSRVWQQPDNTAALLELPQSLNLQPDAKLTLQMPGRGFGLLVSFCYLLPAVLLVAGAWLGSGFASTADIGALAGAFAGLIVGSVVLRLYDSSGGGQAWFHRIKISSAAEAE